MPVLFRYKRATTSAKEEMMPRFTIGARVRVADEKTNDRIGTVVEVLPKSQQTGDYDAYRIKFNDGMVETVSDLQLSPAGSGPPVPKRVVVSALRPDSADDSTGQVRGALGNISVTTNLEKFGKPTDPSGTRSLAH